MKKIALLLVMVLGVIPTMWADISVQTKIFDAYSQPMLVGGFIQNYSKQNVSKKGVIVSKNANNMIITDDTVFDNATIFLQGKTTGRINNPCDIRFIDCTDANEEQFACALQFLIGNTDYYVKAFVIDKDCHVFYGRTENVHTQNYNRYNGWADYGNVWYAFDYTLFDLTTDEIIDPNNGFYYSTNENPLTVRHQVGTNYNTCYKYLTEWNYKLWYSQWFGWDGSPKKEGLSVHLPVMRYADGLLTIEKNPLDSDKDITIYYSINGNYFRPETYTDVYTAPIEITEPCAVYCYAISSEGYISYTNMYVVSEEQVKDTSKNGYKSLNDYIATSTITSNEYEGYDICITPIIRNIMKIYVDLTKETTNSSNCYLRIRNNENTKEIHFSSKYLKTSSDNFDLVENNSYKGKYNIKKLADNNTFPFVYYNPKDSNEVIIDVSEYFGCVAYISDWQRNFGTSCIVNIETDDTFGTVADVVDLGLSVKWASWNVGASSIGDYGELYGAGDPTGIKISTNADDYYFKDDESICGTDYDLAHVLWGENWRMPTFAELKELKEKCTWKTNVNINGVLGSLATGPNGNSIFIPYAGSRHENEIFDRDYRGSLYSGDMGSPSFSSGYMDLDILNDGRFQMDGCRNWVGQSIRPVYVEHTSDTYGKVPDIIDLGLSSGTLWASWNLGASSPEEYGAYFAWGETSPKNNYDWSTYKFGEPSNFTKYNTNDGLTELELEDDAANVILGKDWRMPTHKEELELVNECSWESVELNGISGYKVTGPNGNSIFLPRGGLYDGTDYDCDGTTISNVNTCGWYWSSTLNSVGSAYAQGLCFFPSLLTNVIDHERCDGHNIRPVYIRSLTPTDDNGGVDYGNDDIDDNSNLNGNIIGNIYYNISDENGEYSSTEGCIILRKPTTDTDMNNLEGQDIFGEDFKNGFTGIVFMVQASSGTIKVNAESVGSMTLKVKIGSNTPMTIELEGKMKASIPYSVTKPTYVYIYGGETTNASRITRAASNTNALKLYGIEWSGEVTTSIKTINNEVEYNAVIYNMSGQRVNNPTKGLYIKNRKKYMVK